MNIEEKNNTNSFSGDYAFREIYDLLQDVKPRDVIVNAH